MLTPTGCLQDESELRYVELEHQWLTLTLSKTNIQMKKNELQENKEKQKMQFCTTATVQLRKKLNKICEGCWLVLITGNLKTLYGFISPNTPPILHSNRQIDVT